MLTPVRCRDCSPVACIALVSIVCVVAIFGMVTMFAITASSVRPQDKTCSTRNSQGYCMRVYNPCADSGIEA